MPSSEVKSLHGKKAAAVRWARPDVADVTRDLAAAKLEDYVQRIVSEAPPLTPSQKSRIAALLGGAA